MLFLLLVLLPLVVANKSIEYLTMHGYITENAKTDDINSAITLFQEVYHLEPTGILDNATLELLDQPRCGNEDVIQPFTANPHRKWNSTVITWFMYGTTQYSGMIQKAFDMWGKYTNLEFKRSFTDPKIILSFSGQRKHTNYARQKPCSYDFDGPGFVLAHAFLPESDCNKTDIHFDSDENWDFSMNLPTSGNISFYLTLIHEIGHALGLEHSYNNLSVMYPYNNIPRGIAKLDEFDLSNDDKLAIQYMYGYPPTTTTTSTTTTTTTATTTTTTSSTTTTTTSPAPLSNINICDLKNYIRTFIIVNKKIFVFYQQYVWVLNIDPARRDKEEYTKALRITDWLNFLPPNFNEVSAIYQRPNGDITLITGDDMYIFKFPELTILTRYGISSILGRNVKKINTAVSTNRGKTYIFTDDSYVFEINECNHYKTFLGSPSSVFNGIPEHVVGAFRYINGMLYFFTASSVLEYNEFTSTVVRSVPDIFGILQIACMRETLINRLLEVIDYLQ